ncbi:MAG: type 1 glutamine amidotransferase domain-containing protein [Rhodospirillaceae bacterium]
MQDLSGKKIAILATHGFEKSELLEPRDRLRRAGAAVEVVAPEGGRIRSWKGTDWDEDVEVDRTVDRVSAGDYDALVLPGGQINPDLLRVDDNAMAFVRDFVRSGKTVGAICHGPWLLIEAGAVRDLRATSYTSIRTDMINAGADWVDEEAVCDRGIVTSRNPDDLPAFCDKIAEEVREGRRSERAAA